MDFDFSTLPADVRQDPTLLGDLIMDEIESVLPEIIHGLKIPPVLDKTRKQRLEFGLIGRKGFRPLRGAERDKAIEQLEEFRFWNALRTVQHTVSAQIQGTSDTPLGRPNDQTFWQRAIVERLEWDTSKIPQYDTSPLKETTNQFTRPEFNFTTPNIVNIRENGGVATLISSQEHKQETLEVPDVPIELQEPLAGRDIRGLIGLLRGGRLIAFVEPQVTKLIPEEVEKIAAPSTKVYRSLKVEDLMTEYHSLISKGVRQTPEILAELVLIDALLTAMENEAQWARINRRRFHLINKKYSAAGLSENELREMELLQELTKKQMYAALELPFTELAMLETYAKSIASNERSQPIS